jgi:AcrR family transcriptional regulator
MSRFPLPYFVSDTDAPAKQSVLLAAMDLFATRGVDGVTVRDIAAQSGFTNPAIFKHFKTKDELARSLFETCYRKLAATVIFPTADLRSAITRSLSLVETSPDSVHFVLENLRRFWRELPEDVRTLGLLGAMRRLIEHEQTNGNVRGEIDPQLAAALVLGMIAQIARMAHFGELPRPPSELARDVFNLIDRGLGA